MGFVANAEGRNGQVVMEINKKPTQIEYLVGDKWMSEGSEFDLNSVRAIRTVSYMNELESWKINSALAEENHAIH